MSRPDAELSPVALRVVPPFRTEFTAEQIEQALLGIRNVLRTGRLVLGPYTEQFEAEFSKLVENRYTVAVNSGSTALEILLRTVSVAGKDVLVPSNTNFATARSVVAAGGRPVFYDAGLWFVLQDVLDRLTDATAAVVVVHIGGYMSPDLPQLVAELAKRGIELIEDAAHAHGSTLDGRAAGAFGHAAFSFFPTKVLTTCEGGMVVTADPDVARSARSYRDQGKDDTGDRHVVAGNSWRMTEPSAVLGLVQLRDFTGGLRRRNMILHRYATELGGLLRFPTVGPADILSGHKAVVMCARWDHAARDGSARNRIRHDLLQAGVQLAREVYAVPLHRQPVFASVTTVAEVYHRTNEFCDRHLCLPLWTGMTDEDVDTVVEAVRVAASAQRDT